MSENLTNVEPKGQKETFKSSGTQGLAASLKQGLAQMSHDIAKIISESFKAFKSEFELQYEDMAGEEPEENPEAADEDHEAAEGLPAKKRDAKLQTSGNHRRSCGKTGRLS